MNLASARTALRSIRRSVFHDFGLKLASLAAALTLFYLVHGAEDAQKSVYVDLIALAPAEESGRMLVSEVPVRVRVTLTGSRSQLNAIRQDQLAPVQIDLRGNQGSEYYFADEDLDLPVGVEIAQWAPASIPLRYAIRAERALPVEPRFEDDLPEELSFGEVVAIVPSTVMIAGPEEEVDTLQEIPTDAISLARFGPGEHQVRIRLVRPREHSEYVDANSVLVRFTIAAEQRERRIEDLPISALGGQVRSIRPARVHLRLSGPQAKVDALDPDHVIPFVSVAELSADQGGTPMEVRLRGIPEGVEVVSVDPPEVIVTKGP